MDASELLAAKKLAESTLTLNLGGGASSEVLLRALPRKQYRALLDSHPGVEGDDDWNPDTFPPALIAASAVEPEFTVPQATQLWEEWEAAESGKLFLACFRLNEKSQLVGFTLPGSAPTGDSGQNSTTASQ